MKVVIAMDSFKGALAADAACRAVAAGVRDADSGVEVVCKPMADGGEGTAATLLAARPGGEWLSVRVPGPLPERMVEAGYAWFSDDATAVVEMAVANGLPLLAAHERNPLETSTYGSGVLIRAAVRHGARRIFLAIGGSATVDGGMGAAAALGWRFLDGNGRCVRPVGGSLNAVTRIELPARLELPQVTVLCDVTNPLCGPNGAAAVFGPQKGATPDMVMQLETGLENLAARIRQDLGMDVREIAGGGAAGGLGAGATAFFHADRVPGIETIIRVSGLREALVGADWCVTGEGAFDRQSLDGKVVAGVTRAAQESGVPVVVFAGQVRLAPEVYTRHGVRRAYPLQSGEMSLAASIRQTATLLRNTAATWCAGWRACR